MFHIAWFQAISGIAMLQAMSGKDMSGLAMSGIAWLHAMSGIA